MLYRFDPRAVAPRVWLLALLLLGLTVGISMSSKTLCLLSVHELVWVMRWQLVSLRNILDTIGEFAVVLLRLFIVFNLSVLHHGHGVVNVSVYCGRTILFNLVKVLEAFNVCNVLLVALAVHLGCGGLAPLLKDGWDLLLHLKRVLVVEMVVLLFVDLLRLQKVIFVGVGLADCQLGVPRAQQVGGTHPNEAKRVLRRRLRHSVPPLQQIDAFLPLVLVALFRVLSPWTLLAVEVGISQYQLLVSDRL